MTGPVGRQSRLQELLAIMARLRAADGCPWDREQTFASIAPFTIEEAYEVADAVERGDPAALKDELGDLLFQVVFHAQIASEAGEFDFEAVAGAICDKLIRRHPHVFGAGGRPMGEGPLTAGPLTAGPLTAGPLTAARPLTAAEQSAAWEDIKAQERAAAAAGLAAAGPAAARTLPSHLDGVSRALPSLARAYKLSKRAARAGFDFEHADQTADKVAEELAEVRDAAAQQAQSVAAREREASGASPQIVEEIGDLLFAAANLARKLDVDAEAALRAANAKFERRFRGMESLAAQRGEVFADLNLDAQERLWQEVKRGE